VGHSLRMIRSGAAALLGPDGTALAAAYGGVPIYPTYSMSEQMPISQPPAGKLDTFTSKPGSVGVPVAASTAIVSRSRYRPQPPGTEGEIAICGPTVLKKYLNNPSADLKAYFYLSLKEDRGNNSPYFLTGDVGVIDSEGFLSLKGRAKELIKKGGEQVSPFEVEEPLLDHEWVQIPVCFAVPSKLYGEEVGCAIIFSPKAPKNLEEKKIITEFRMWLKEAKLAPAKWPTIWYFSFTDDLPKTKTKKYKRIGLSTHLGLDPKEFDEEPHTGKETKAVIDWGVISGFRFVLACYVMFMHIGSDKSWATFSNLRGWPWHVHVFFTLGGYSLASPMNPIIKNKWKYFMARIGSMYTMYAMALLFGLINLVIVCRPSTFSKNFHWDSQPYDLKNDDGTTADLFCEGTPIFQDSYWASLFSTLVVYIFGLAVTPTWGFNWWLGYYLWFSSMYYMCLAVFPVTYNIFYAKVRGKTSMLLKIMLALLILNHIVCIWGWMASRGAEGYDHYNPDLSKNYSGQSDEDYDVASQHNIDILSFYLFGPFWLIYFIIGCCAGFLYDAYRPNARHNVWKWGLVADSITVFMLCISILVVCQGSQPEGGPIDDFYMVPEQADEYYADATIVQRIWSNVGARFYCPVTTLWIFALSTGEGITASILRTRYLVEVLSPNAYNCFLFHQMIGQWYYAATRNGHMWNWWRYRKTMYWFSPSPCPVEWYEYFYVVSMVVAFSSFMTSAEPIAADALSNLKGFFIEAADEEEQDTYDALVDVIEGMTGIEPMIDWTLEECGLASIGVPVLVGLLNKTFSKKKSRTLKITAPDLIVAETIGDMVDVIDAAKALADDQGV